MCRINPVYKKELKMMARSKHLPVVSVIFNAILAFVALIIIYCVSNKKIYTEISSYKVMFPFYMAILSIEVILFCFFVPSAASGSIAGERERQTLDILLASKMSVPGIIFGKLMSCISLAIFLGVSSLPILVISMAYGGIGVSDIYQSVAYVGFVVIFVGCIGIFCSCCFKKTTFATITAYGIILGLTLGTTLIVLLFNTAFGWEFFSGGNGAGGVIYLWLFNPAVTYIALFTRQFFNVGELEEILIGFGASEWMAQHWIMFSILIQIILSIIFIALSVKYLNPLNQRRRRKRKK